MRRLLEVIGEFVTGQFNERKERYEDDTRSRHHGSGCLFSGIMAFVFAVGIFVVIVMVVSGGPIDTSPADTPTLDASSVSTIDIESTGASPPAMSGAGAFVDADNPTDVIPAAGGWLIDNGMFVPNCGPDDPEPGTTRDTGTIDVWASGAVLELTGSDGASIRFERTTVSDAEATYASDVGFVSIELVFDAPTRFDASISYEGDDQCVRRSAAGILTQGDDTRQHGAQAAPASPSPGDGGIGSAEEGTIAIVTIGDDSYEFFPEGPAGTCDPDFFGGFHAVLYSDGFTDAFNVDLIPDGSRVSSASMTVRALDLDLVADADGDWAAVAPGTSAVVDFTIEGSTASGSLLFINEDRAFNGANYPLESIEATFTVTCGTS